MKNVFKFPLSILMIRRGFAAVVALLLFAACAKEAAVEPAQPEPEGGENPYFVSYEKALVGMQELMEELDDQPATRGGQPMRRIASHYTHSFGKSATLAEGETSGNELNTDVYVVNFEDELTCMPSPKFFVNLSRL